MTHMELIHGALRTMSRNAMFMMRDSTSIKNIPEAYRGEFMDNSVLAKASLKVNNETATECVYLRQYKLTFVHI